MGDHADIDHTGLTGVGGSLTVQDEGGALSTAATTLNFVGAGVTASGTTATKTITIPGGSGLAPGQAVAYPTSFTGDTIDGSSTTPFADVSAFSTKEVLNSRILHLVTLGASRDHKVRVTLGTTKAAAYDVRTCVMFQGNYWSSQDVWLEVRGSTTGDAQLFACRLLPDLENADSTNSRGYRHWLRVGHSTITSQNDNFEPSFPWGMPVTLRIQRDGSNVLTFSYGYGTAPMALAPIEGINQELYAPTASGTLARIEYSIHTPAGPGASDRWDAWVDYVQSV